VLDSHYVVSFFHRFGGFLFMALVPLELVTPRLRARHINFHRWCGRFLVVVGLIFGVSALVMAGRFRTNSIAAGAGGEHKSLCGDKRATLGAGTESRPLRR
jgi:hypothetical protein